MLRVDNENIPKIVQSVKYLWQKYAFKITLFNKKEIFISAEKLIKHPPNFLYWYISKEQIKDAYIEADKRELELFHGRL